MTETADASTSDARKKPSGWNKLRAVVPSIGAIASISNKSRVKLRSVAGHRGKVSEKKVLRMRKKEHNAQVLEESDDEEYDGKSMASVSTVKSTWRTQLGHNSHSHEWHHGGQHEDDTTKNPLDSPSDDEFDDEHDPSQLHYLRACERVGVIPAKLFFNSLPFDELKVRHHCLGAKGAKACAIALVNNVTVESLDLSYNNIREEGADFLADMLVENDHIRAINLGHNALGSVGTSKILNAIKLNPQIRKLNLSGNGLMDLDAKRIADLFEVNYTMKELKLSNNEFGEEGGIIFGEIIGTISNTLEVVDLSWNHIRRRGAISIANGLKENMTIREVHLAMNGFHFDGCKAFAEALVTNTTIEYLDLSNNRIEKEGLLALMKGVKVNEVLKTLLLSHNPISVSGAFEMVNILREIPSDNLKLVDIWDQPVDKEFKDTLESMKTTKPLLVVKHGIYFWEKVKILRLEQFDQTDPMLILLESMNMMNMKLVDFFKSLDDDGSQSLSREEFETGLKENHIPMTDADIERLLNQLDKDGDGEVDFGELMAAQKASRRKLAMMKALGGKPRIASRPAPKSKFGAKVHSLYVKQEQGELDINNGASEKIGDNSIFKTQVKENQNGQAKSGGFGDLVGILKKS